MELAKLDDIEVEEEEVLGSPKLPKTHLKRMTTEDKVTMDWKVITDKILLI